MRIPGLIPFLLQDLPIQQLKNTTVVIDGEVIFSSVNIKLPISQRFGCESDQIANSTREYLMKFQKAKLDCHFVLKGEINNNKKLYHNNKVNKQDSKQNVYMKPYEYHKFRPIFIIDILSQTLDEMGFKYVISNGDHVTACIALALKLSCPLIGNNIQYFFSQAQYVPELKTKLDKNNNLLSHIHTLSNFMEKYNMTEEKVTLFIMLSDQHIIKEEQFMLIFRCENVLHQSRNTLLENLVNWISRKSVNDVLKKMHCLYFLTFIKKKNELEELLLNRKEADTKMTLYVTDETKCQFTKLDPDWFEKGVFCKRIPIPYINLYQSKTVTVHEENLITLPMMQYAFDLLTNYEGKINVKDSNDMSFERASSISKRLLINSIVGEIEHENCSSSDTDHTLTETDSSIQKPDYKATINVFENGWEDIKPLNLFEHFVTETLQSFDFERLNKAPADCRLLLIALVYFSRKKPDVKLEVYSILLSYVMLSVVTEKLKKENGSRCRETENISETTFIDSFTDKDLVTTADCDIARSLMDEYFKCSNEELSYIYNHNALQPLTEFQHCLKELNNLNQLCGSQFDQTVYSKTYNSTIVFKILHAMKECGSQDGFHFIQTKLRPTPTVLAFLSGILGIYESIYYDYN